MMLRILPLLLMVASLPLAAVAADGESTVTASVMGTVEKPADAMRLQVEMHVQAPTLKDALEKLKERKAQVKEGLVKLGADEKSFEPGDVSVSDPNGGDQRSAMERMMRERMAGRAGAGAAPAA